MPFDKSALMVLIEESARNAEDQHKLSYMLPVSEIYCVKPIIGRYNSKKISLCRTCAFSLSRSRTSWSITWELYLEDIAQGTQLMVMGRLVIVNALTVIHC